MQFLCRAAFSVIIGMASSSPRGGGTNCNLLRFLFACCLLTLSRSQNNGAGKTVLDDVMTNPDFSLLATAVTDVMAPWYRETLKNPVGRIYSDSESLLSSEISCFCASAAPAQAAIVILYCV